MAPTKVWEQLGYKVFIPEYIIFPYKNSAVSVDTGDEKIRSQCP